MVKEAQHSIEFYDSNVSHNEDLRVETLSEYIKLVYISVAKCIRVACTYVHIIISQTWRIILQKRMSALHLHTDG